MMLGTYIYNRLASSTTITGITSNITPDISSYSDIPAITYKLLAQPTNIKFRKASITLKGIETTQEKCETLMENIYNLFDGTTSRIYGSSSDLKIESIGLLNFIPSLRDEVNSVWYGIFDIRINYQK